ncbi:MAG: adenylate/guanylate cyclase domain-containing protein [Bacteriovoracia bacterium]
MESELDLTQQHYSTKIFRGYLYYLQRNCPEIDLAALCRRAGLPLEYIENGENWVSAGFAVRFTELCIQETKLRDFTYRAGEVSISEELVGRSLYLLVKYVIPLKSIYKQIPVFTAMFSKVTEVSVLSFGRNHIELRFQVNPQMAGSIDRETAKRALQYALENTIGYYTALPTIQNLAPARIDSDLTEDETRGASYRMRIQFESHAPYWQTASFLLVPPLAGLAAWFAYRQSGSWLLSVLSAGVFAFAGISMNFWARHLRLKRSVKQSLDALSRMDRRYHEVFAAKEKSVKLADSYSRFVPWELLKLLNKQSILDIQLGDFIERRMTVLFSDVRDFTRISEGLSPQETFNFLNSYLGRVSPIIRKHGGFIDNFIGDGIIAIFPGSAQDAMRAAVEMSQQLDVYNQHRAQSGYETIRIGLGLNTGRVILGTIGNVQQMRGTVISDCVNTASRLEGLTKQMGATILLSEETYRELGEESRANIRWLGHAVLKGKSEPVSFYHAYAAEGPFLQERLSRSRRVFEAGIAALEAGRPKQAARHFEEALAICPDDRVAGNLNELIWSKRVSSLPLMVRSRRKRAA